VSAVDESITRTWQVNGAETEVRFTPAQRLLDVLRDGLGLTGTKEGCGEGECGACSVLIDGELKLACLTLAVALPPGTEVLTIEGLAARPGGRRLQREANQRGAVQCGFCTPGMLLAGYWLLDHQDIPARIGLSGNLCRCTGYQKLVDTVVACRRPVAPGDADGEDPA